MCIEACFTHLLPVLPSVTQIPDRILRLAGKAVMVPSVPRLDAQHASMNGRLPPYLAASTTTIYRDLFSVTALDDITFHLGPLAIHFHAGALRSKPFTKFPTFNLPTYLPMGFKLGKRISSLS